MQDQNGETDGGETADTPASNRRSFLKWSIGGLSAGVTGILAWPMIAYLVGPAFRGKATAFFAVAKVDQIAAGGPVKLRFHFIAHDAFLRERKQHQVWAIKTPSGQFTVFSPICPHLGCYYRWHLELKKFICPCHNSVFSESGTVLSGPAPRPLDTLPYKIVNGTLFVAWERFQVGVAKKVRI